MALGEHLARLLRNSDERGPAAELFEFGCSYICACRTQATQDVSDGVLHITFIRHLHGPALRRPTETKIRIIRIGTSSMKRKNEAYTTCRVLGFGYWSEDCEFGYWQLKYCHYRALKHGFLTFALTLKYSGQLYMDSGKCLND